MSLSARTVDQSECLLRLVEAAPQVSRRHQFFLWTQGDLQRWLPHKLLVCGSYDRSTRELSFDVFNSVPIPEPLLRSLQDAREPLVAAVLKHWKLRQFQPCYVGWSELLPPGGPTPSAEMLSQAGYRQVLVHGLCRPGRPDEIESVFFFSAPDCSYNEDSARSLDMLFPCLHMTYLRVHTNERRLAGVTGGVRAAPEGIGLANNPRGRVITDREREILLWVRDGLNNQQISEKLGISALTVKNHIQKILRKLGAANRAQAVARAMTINALGGAPVVETDLY